MNPLLAAAALSSGFAASLSVLALFWKGEAEPPRGKVPSLSLRGIATAGLAWAAALAFPGLSVAWQAAAAALLVCAAAIPAIIWRLGERERVCLMKKELPTLLDSLVLRTEAGMPLTSALLGTQEVFPSGSPTAAQIALFGRDLDMGRTAVEALEGMRERMRSTGAEAPIGALIRGLELGTPVRAILAEQSERIRQSLLIEAERFANTLSIRLLVPLLLFIFPASFLVILSPVIVFLLGERPW